MVKSVPMRDHSLENRQRRRSGTGIKMFLFLVLIASLLLLGLSFFSPARLALAQERMLSVLHGGIAASEERTYVEVCVQVSGFEGPQAVTRTVRTTSFRDGSSISVTFNSRPTPTNSQCGGGPATQ